MQNLNNHEFGIFNLTKRLRISPEPLLSQPAQSARSALHAPIPLPLTDRVKLRQLANRRGEAASASQLVK